MTKKLEWTEKLFRASSPEGVFGDLASLDELNHQYRSFAKDLHPDLFREKEDIELATQGFQFLTMMRDLAARRLELGIYGDVTKPTPAPDKPAAPVVIKLKDREIIVGPRIMSGDIADLYQVLTKEPEHPFLLKVAKNAKDNDLMQAEERALTKLFPKDQKSEGFYRYIPKLVDSFMLKGKNSNRRAHLFRHYSTHVSLAQVRAAYPGGLDFRDAAWMFRRLLEALGHVHREGFVHGAVLPEHVLVKESNHGAKLVDWCYSVEIGKPLKAMSGSRVMFYPPEVAAKNPATSATDIYMAAVTVLHMMSGVQMPPSVSGFFASCVVANPLRRPQDAWALHEEFGALLERLCGKPSFRLLKLPTATESS